MTLETVKPTALAEKVLAKRTPFFWYLRRTCQRRARVARCRGARTMMRAKKTGFALVA